MEDNNLLNNSQFGFRAGKSTDAVYELTKYITEHLDTNKKILTIFLDLSKAFDTVAHPILLNKLEKIGIRGVSLRLLENYLTNRTQQVKIKNTYSEEREIKIGVPQGTVIGPILFLIYINDIVDVNIGGEMISYADDTVLMFQDKCWETTKQKAEKGLSLMKEWLDNNLLTLNESKTYFMCFSIYNVNRPHYDKLIIHNKLCVNNKFLHCKCSTKIKNT